MSSTGPPAFPQCLPHVCQFIERQQAFSTYLNDVSRLSKGMESRNDTPPSQPPKRVGDTAPIPLPVRGRNDLRGLNSFETTDAPKGVRYESPLPFNLPLVRNVLQLTAAALRVQRTRGLDTVRPWLEQRFDRTGRPTGLALLNLDSNQISRSSSLDEHDAAIRQVSNATAA